MNILAVGCHPDDLEIGCFGTLIKYVQAGHKVFAMHVTNGNLGHVRIMPVELGEIRNKEAEAAARLIGAEPLTLDIGDLRVDSRDERQLKRMAEIIRRVKPDLIITHNPEDYMTDHMETSKLVFDASFAASVPHFEAEGEACLPAPVYYMDTAAGINFIPTEYVDISEQMLLKEEAVSMHKSQIKWLLDHDGIDFVEFVRACNRGRGCQCGVKYAEGFRPCLRQLRMSARRLLPE